MRVTKRLLITALAGVMGIAPLPVAQAQGGTTYDIQTGASFFEQGIPGFSTRVYPPAVKVHQGDVLHFFGFGVPLLFNEGVHHDEFQEANAVTIGDPYFDVVPDPDDGSDALKFNPIFEIPTDDCSSASDPCEWDGDGSEDELLNAGFVEEGWVEITAEPGDVIWGAVSPRGHIRIEVVADSDEASDQDALDVRAAKMLDKDTNDLTALHHKLLRRRSSHRTPSGRRVIDAWAGFDKGPLSLEAMYPRNLTIKRGDSVQWHFDLEFNAHTVTIPISEGARIVRGYEDPASPYGPKCDPDGDDGAGPDIAPTFTDEGPQCPAGSELEFDVSNEELEAAGNGVFRGRNDVEHSGIKLGQTLQERPVNADPFTVRFTKRTGRRGIRYVCTVHFPFMNGRIRVRRR